MQALGYKSDNNGVCYGISHTAMVAALQYNSAEYNSYLDVLSKISSEQIVVEMEKAIEAVNNNTADKQQLVLVQVKPLFDTIELIHRVSSFPELFEKNNRVFTQDFVATMDVVSPLGLDENPILLNKGFCGGYTKANLKKYFTSLHKALNHCVSSAGLSFGSKNHQISIVHTRNHWLFCNAGYIEVLQFEEVDKLVDKVMAAFGCSNDIASFYTNVYLRKKAELNFQAGIEKWINSTIKTNKKNLSSLSQDINEYGPLVAIAAKGGDVNYLQLLIKANANINEALDDGVTPACVAAENGNIECLKILIAAKADINKPSNDGATPMFMAAQNGNVECLKDLIHAKADINKARKNGTTPVVMAATNDNIECLKILMAAKADINKQSDDGASPAFMAAQNGNVECLKALIGANANINQVRNDGATPAFIAAEIGNFKCLKILIDSGVKVDTQLSNGATPAFAAAEKGNIECLNVLIDAGVKVDTQLSNGTTPVFMAAQNGHIECLKALLSAGAKVNAQFSNGETPVFMAAQNGNVECLKALLSAGADISQARNDGVTPVMIATHFKRLECLKVLNDIKKVKQEILKTISGLKSDKTQLLNYLSQPNIVKTLKTHRGENTFFNRSINFFSGFDLGSTNSWRCTEKILRKAGATDDEINAVRFNLIDKGELPKNSL